MADKNDRLTMNVSGQFYVDESCIDCGQCPDTAPDFFLRDDESGFSFVHRQPVGGDEFQNAMEALTACPTDSIGNDG